VGPTLWVIERSGSTVHLFGETVGLGRNDVWMGDAIRDAFDQAAEFWCEVADTQQVARDPALARHGLSTEPLSRFLQPSELAELQDVCRTLEVDPPSLDGMRPWLAAQLLEQVHRSRAGIDADTSVHDVLLASAKQAGKKVRTELRDSEATLSFFGVMSEPVEREYLLWTLDRVRADPEENVAQVVAWMAGDASVVAEQLARMKTQYPSLYEYLIFERNRAWVPRIDAMLDRANSFVLVGDSHMATDDGIPNLLTVEGFAPRRVT
jgi:hypothetical protein